MSYNSISVRPSAVAIVARYLAAGYDADFQSCHPERSGSPAPLSCELGCKRGAPFAPRTILRGICF